MKKPSRKLILSRETLRALDPMQLTATFGGGPRQQDTWWDSCFCYTETPSVCASCETVCTAC